MSAFWRGGFHLVPPQPPSRARACRAPGRWTTGARPFSPTRSRDLHRRGRHDAVLVHYVWMSRVLEGIGGGALRVLDTHDLFGDRHLAAREQGLDPSWFFTTRGGGSARPGARRPGAGDPGRRGRDPARAERRAGAHPRPHAAAALPGDRRPQRVAAATAARRLRLSRQRQPLERRLGARARRGAGRRARPPMAARRADHPPRPPPPLAPGAARPGARGRGFLPRRRVRAEPHDGRHRPQDQDGGGAWPPGCRCSARATPSPASPRTIPATVPRTSPAWSP